VVIFYKVIGKSTSKTTKIFSGVLKGQKQIKPLLVAKKFSHDARLKPHDACLNGHHADPIWHICILE